MKTVQVSRAGAVIGQFEPAEVRQGLIVGKFLATDHYWITGMKGWMPLSQFNEGSAGSITSSASKPKAGSELAGRPHPRVPLVPDRMAFVPERMDFADWWTIRFVMAFIYVAMLFLVWFFLKYDAENPIKRVRVDVTAQGSGR
jgi:hypothetical protein